ncbi:hypothetical protein CFB3_10590 [Clostridium folliculivorans]|uniref:Uncharacterized protein n=1 Tax=Clostridium folliculivorans TaxID=2886038 RepID=A0A9W5Y4Y6_9CLOT|nr:hypothetical protein CFOLD11_34420 [Clostridium folliculivorans]GKU28953.1 hypothetical protein CFB3_10590 [Clostridium folliculivorans]
MDIFNRFDITCYEANEDTNKMIISYGNVARKIVKINLLLRYLNSVKNTETFKESQK